VPVHPLQPGDNRVYDLLTFNAERLGFPVHLLPYSWSMFQYLQSQMAFSDK
jgi:hypothetical protein